jgi:hypothetical protein
MPSLFGPIGDTVGGWVDTAADVVEEVVEVVEEVVSDAVETVGSAIEDGADAVADAASNIPGVGPALSAFFGWAGDVAYISFALAGAVIKGIGSITSGLIAGSMRVLGGILTLNLDLLLTGLGDIASGVLGGLLIPLAVLASWVQTVIVVGQGRSRRLNEAEMEIVRRVYRNAIALYNVRIVFGFAGIYSLSSSKMVIGNTIYFKNSDPIAEAGLLAHEVCHVWQYQHRGSRYMTDAIYAQWFVDEYYRWELEIERGNEQWVNFNPEGQGQMFRDIWVNGMLVASGSVSDPGGGRYYRANGDDLIALMVHLHDGEGDEDPFKVDHTEMVDETVRVVRSEQSYRLSQFLE